MESSPVSNQALPAGTRLEEFVIERVLGSGGFGITYLARDTSLNRQVVIKENLPAQFAWRETTTGTVRPRHTSGGDADDYAWSMNNFLREAETLASLDHPGIVRVLRKFEANGTAYFVMPFVDGVAFDTLIEDRRAKGQPFSDEELKGLLDHLLHALGYLHDRGIYHRDIKPGNILISNQGVPALIDFGSARQRLSERSMTVVESAGYTPFEQLQSRGNVGPWSDLYALGATIVKAITFEALPKAADRVMDDPWLGLATHPKVSGWYSPALLRSIDRAVQSSASARWQDAGEWREGLRGGVSAGAAHSQTTTHQPSDSKATQAPPAKTAGVTESEPGDKTSPPLRQRFGKQRGRDLRFDLEISQQAATSGIEKEIEIDRLVACGTCQSTGSKGGGGAGPCGSCGGRGVIVGHGGKMVQETTCPECQGAGEVVSDPCGSCQGEGRAEKPSRVRFRIPASVEDGSRVRLAGYGDAGVRGGEVGDLYLFLSVTDSPRDGADEAVNSAGAIAPALWNPTTAVYLGWILTPAFGAFLHARNSKTLGHSAEEKSGMYWFYGMAACGFFGMLSAGSLRYFGGINPLMLILWYFISAQKQINLVEATFGKNYSQKSFAKPLFAGIACLVATMIFVEGRHSLGRDESAPVTAGEVSKADAGAVTEKAEDAVDLFNRGVAYATGDGVTQDLAEAVRCYRRAAESGYAAAQLNLGICYDNGEGVTTDDAEAVKWYRKAAEQGNATAQLAIGACYDNGEGVTLDNVEAVKWYSMAAEQGNTTAQFNLGHCYDKGEGVARNTVESAKWYRKAAEQGHKGSKEALVRLGE
jgi:serine/threonine protein kinase